ncbi:hypothetical protein Tco_0608205 [Tanacetum coccineum]
MLEVSSWKEVVDFEKKEMLAPRYKYLEDTNLHVHLEEIKVDKTLCFVKEPVEIIEREVKSLKRSRILIVKSIGTRIEVMRILQKTKYPYLLVEQAIVGIGYKSIERDRLVVIEIMVAMDISLCSHFSDNENDVACRDLEAAFEYSACASRAATTLSATSFLMATRVLAGASDVDVLLGGILST